MATTVARLQAILSANTHDFDRAMDRSQTRMGKMGSAAKLAGVAVAGGIAYGLEKSVHRAIEAERSQARLEQAFKNSGLEAGRYAKQIDTAETAGRKLGFTDDQTRQSLGSLLVSTGNVADSMKQLAVAQDLARFKGVDLEQATKALTMAHAGSLRPLKQLGLDIPKVSSAQDRLKASVKDHTSEAYKNALAVAKQQDKQATFANVLQTVTNKTHGQAKAYSDTAEGGMAEFNAQMQHLEETIGEKLLPALTKVIDKLNRILEWTSKNKGPSMIDVVNAIGDAFKYVWQQIDHATRSVESFYKKIKGPSGIDIIKGIGHKFGDVKSADFTPPGLGGPKSISPRLYDELAGARAMGLTLTSGYRPGAVTKHGTKSDHSYYPSHAIDVAGPPNRMASFFRWLIGQTDVKQAFYDPLGSIFGGQLSSYREGGHSDHVHVATYDQGGFLQPGWNLAYNGTGRPEQVVRDASRGSLHVHFHGPVLAKEQQIVQLLRNAVRTYERNNGRTAFGF